ncbi:MAG TPA: ABC transporter ATP-binding protein [Acidimicrobiia bacterium]|nr:ABC transporter ATP-binding protein [Acidimicrobiia bacterium]
MALLELQDVTSGYGYGPDILNGISLSIEAGEAYCIIGPNGAGKSTLLKTVAGLLRPRRGEILLDGAPFGGRRPDLVLGSGICYVPQDRSLFPEMSVRENLVMGAFLESDRSVVSGRMDRVFEMFPVLADRVNQRAGTMSGGEQQMLALGRALMIEPRMLMIDEPSLGLAPQVADQIFDIIRQLSELKITLLLVEQNVLKGLDCTNRAFLLDLGELRLEAPSDEILDDPRIRELYLGRQRTATQPATGNGEQT